MVRFVNLDKFRKCVELREKGLSYSEIKRIVPVAKSTLQGWLNQAGLLQTKKHLEIQLKKRIANRRAGTEASRLTREKKIQAQIQLFIEGLKGRFAEQLLVGGCMLYEAEGQRKADCVFSNSDYRIINYFLRFIEKYFDRSRNDGTAFRLYIHKNRENDLRRILNFWSRKLSVPKENIAITWKKHQARIRNNKDYVGQISVKVKRSSVINRQIHALSSIILES